MDGFGLLLGHLLGDYVLQNDWQAANKVNGWCGLKPKPKPEPGLPLDYLLPDWEEDRYKWRVGNLACTVHCLLYTLAVWVCSWSWMPWQGLLVCFFVHWPIDRFRLARWWMDHVSGQRVFAEKMGPWSVIVVDNTFHLLTLYLIALAAGRT